MKAEVADVILEFERLTGEPLGTTSLAGIQRLVDGQVPEDDRVDPKVAAYDCAPTKKGKNGKKDELRNDVSALANGRGGVIVLGVAEQDGLPTKVVV